MLRQHSTGSSSGSGAVTGWRLSGRMVSLRRPRTLSYPLTDVALRERAGRWATASASVQEDTSRLCRMLDQLRGVSEVDRRNRLRTRWRQHDQVRVVLVQLDVGDQPAVGEQAERVECHAERATGGALQSASVSRGQHIDLAGAELDCW